MVIRSVTRRQARACCPCAAAHGTPAASAPGTVPAARQGAAPPPRPPPGGCGTRSTPKRRSQGRPTPARADASRSIRLRAASAACRSDRFSANLQQRHKGEPPRRFGRLPVAGEQRSELLVHEYRPKRVTQAQTRVAAPEDSPCDSGRGRGNRRRRSRAERHRGSPKRRRLQHARENPPCAKPLPTPAASKTGQPHSNGADLGGDARRAPPAGSGARPGCGVAAGCQVLGAAMDRDGSAVADAMAAPAPRGRDPDLVV